jgi:putative ABC transport system permease protein
LNRHFTENGDPKFKTSDWTFLTLRKLTDIHLYSHKDSEIEENGDIKRVYIFSAIALFILLIACINYMNLSTARSSLRAKEIGVRKAIGAGKSELILQFLSESVLLCILATILSLLLVFLTLPWLNQLSGQSLSFGYLLQWQILIILLAMPFIVGISAGIYPAVFLSSFKPVKVLKGIFNAGNKTISFRKALVVIQFSVSIILIISTTVVFQQLRYIQTRSLGFNKDRIVTINNNSGLNTTYEAFKTALLANVNVQAVGRSSRIPSGRLLDANGSQINKGDSLAPTKADIKYVLADEEFIPAYQVKVLAGRNFSKDFYTDTSSFLINEAAVKVLGLKSNQDAIGKQFMYGGRRGQLIGVFQDFNFESLHQHVLPIVLLTSTTPNGYGRISIKVSGSMQTALSHIETTWKRFLPETPFEYTFLDDRFADLYKSEQQQQSIFTIFSFIAIFIACLGLFGLSAFTITQRVKEIGIRKVLGASVGSIVNLITQEFLLLVIIAALIAFPVAWYAMHTWLQDFAYRINITWWVFILSGIVALFVAFATISVQAIKAALNNPVRSLRSE